MVSITRSQPPLSKSGVVLQGISWQTYQALVQELTPEPAKRLIYDNGSLEIWMPLPPHESYKRRLGRLVEIVTEELEIEIRSLSSSTWSREDLLKGVEADECYYIQHEAMVRGKMEIDLTVDPPPDLVIEVDMTSLSLSRLSIYAALGVPEVWRFGEMKLSLLGLVDANYEEIQQSVAIPILTEEILQDWMMRAEKMGETSWARQVRHWVGKQ